MSRTSVKNEAETEKCVAEPPRMCGRSPNGVLIASYATVPTMRMDMRTFQED